jgi:hypothetical protein
MIATERFTYVHQPKTGGTFVTTALFRVHNVPWNLLIHGASTLIPNLVFRGKYGRFIFNNNKHGGCNEIPDRLRRGVTLATVRNPFDLLVSQYEFGWWKRRECQKYYRAVPDFARRFPRFPQLSFGEYVELSELVFYAPGNGDNDAAPGPLTREFMHYYFRDKSRALARFGDDYIDSRANEADMYPVCFLRQDRLNQDLHDFLAKVGYDPADLAFIPGMGRVLPREGGRSPEQTWQRYYTPELKQHVRHRERLLFSLFPEFDV